MNKLRKIAVFENLEFLIDFTKDFLNSNNCSEEIIGDLSLVAEEALVNVISYSYSDNQIGYVDIELLIKDDKIIFNIIDEGVPFNMINAQKPNLTASLEERSIGGVGIHLIKSFVDDMQYLRQDNKNILTLIKNNR